MANRNDTANSPARARAGVRVEVATSREPVTDGQLPLFFDTLFAIAGRMVASDAAGSVYPTVAATPVADAAAERRSFTNRHG